MNQDWIEGFKAALLSYVQYYKTDAAEINSWSEAIDGYAVESGCDTCGWGAEEVYTLTIFYKDRNGDIQEHITNERFGTIVSDLCYYN